jgi:hypothetical protein
MDQYDVFVSYAHVDDEPPTGVETGWVSMFVNHLKRHLESKVGGREVGVWKDDKLAMNDQVDPTLVQSVKLSRTIVLFLSPSYQRSHWCQKELITFLQNHEALKNKESVFIVEIEPVEREYWHARLRELTQIRLYRKEEGDDKPAKRLGYPLPRMEEGTPYWDCVNELAHLIVRHLKLLDPARFVFKAPDVTVANGTPNGTPDGSSDDMPKEKRLKVWLAEPTEDLFDEWDHMARALRQANCEVLPASPETYDRSTAQTFEQAVLKDLNDSVFYAQLLGKREGRRPPDGQRSFTCIQSDLASKHANSGKLFQQWRNLRIELDAVESEPYRQLLTGAIACGFEEFRQQIVKGVEPLVRELNEHKPHAGIEPNPSAICVRAHKHDMEIGEKVAQMLLDMGESSVMPSSEPGPDEVVAQFNEQLRDLIGASEGIIIVYGQSSQLWVQSQYVNAQRTLAPRRRGIWGATVECHAAGKPDSGIRSPSVLMLDCRSGVTPEAISRFLRVLRGGAL